MEKIGYLSLFSGIGGFEHGIETSNKKDILECIGYSEIDKYAKKIYKKHYPNHIDRGDATLIRTEDLPDFDFLVGGFPCQAFSHAGKRMGFDDTRGTLFFEISRILKDKKPKYFLLENVKGLLSHDSGRTFQRMLGILSSLGYHVQWQIYNSKNHGVPQERERLYIKGYLGSRSGQEVLSVLKDGRKTNANTNKSQIKKVGNVSPSNHYQGDVMSVEGLSPTLCARDWKGAKIISMIQVNDEKSHATRIYSTDGVSSTLMAEGGGWGGKTGLYQVDYPKNEEGEILLKNNTKQGYLPATAGDGVVLDFDNAKGRVQRQKTPTLTTSSNVGTVTSELLVRRLTPLECERLQAFPDNWTEYGCDGERISDTQRYRCCGNAVTTTVVRDILNEWEMIF